MEFGLFTSGYQRYPLEKAFEDASRFGYDYIELWGGYPHAYTEDLYIHGTEQIRALIRKYHMPVKCLTPEHNGYPFNYMMGDELQWERCMAYLERAIEVAAAIGAPYMLISAGHAGYQTSQEAIDQRLKKSLERLVLQAEKYQVTLILEPLTIYESNVVNNLNALERALCRVPSPYLAGMCDLAVPFTSGEPSAEYVRRLGKRFRYLHVIDNDGISDSHILPGDGNIPLAAVLSELCDAGYDGPATIELVTGYMKEPSVYAKIAIERIREMTAR
jgi:protein FrlC